MYINYFFISEDKKLEYYRSFCYMPTQKSSISKAIGKSKVYFNFIKFFHKIQFLAENAIIHYIHESCCLLDNLRKQK